MIDFRVQRYAALALAASALFGASAPAAKPLAEGMHPALLAGLLYLGCFTGLACARVVRRVARGVRAEATLARRARAHLETVDEREKSRTACADSSACANSLPA